MVQQRFRIKGLWIALLCLLLLWPGTVHAEDDQTEQSAILERAIAPHIYVADASDLSLCYFVRDEHGRVPPASTTKIIVCLIALERCSLDEIVIVPEEAASLGGTNSLMGLVKNEPIAIEDLLYGLMLPSGNDAANALAIHMAGSIDAFVAQMNERAEALGMVDTTFTNPRGVTRAGHLSTAYDMPLVTHRALQYEMFRKIVSTATHTVPANEVRSHPLALTNRNRLISDPPDAANTCYYPYAIGVKTGTTYAGSCLVSAAQREDVTLICVQLGATRYESNNYRAASLCRSAREMFEYIFENEYAYATAQSLIDAPAVEFPVNGAAGAGTLVAQADPGSLTAYRPIRQIDALKNGTVEFEVAYEVEPLFVPIAAGEQIGTVSYSLFGRVWYTMPLIAQQAVSVPTPTPVQTPVQTPANTPAPASAQQNAVRGMPTGAVLLLCIFLLLFGGAILLLQRRK